MESSLGSVMTDAPTFHQRCPLCGAERIRPRFHYGSWDLAHCQECGLGLAQPLLSTSELQDLYTEEYFDGRFNPAQNYLETGDDQRLWNATLAWIEARVPRGNLLDVGCGCGFFLRSAASRGWFVSGFDASAWAAKHVGETYGIEVHTGRLEDAPFSHGRFDVITLWSTLEHLPDPWSTLRTVAALLRPGGMLCVGVPNYRGWGALLRGSKESNFKREHLYYFTDSTLRRTLAAVGLGEFRRMVIFGGGQNSLAGSLAQYVLRLSGRSNQIMLAATRPRDVPP